MSATTTWRPSSAFGTEGLVFLGGDHVKPCVELEPRSGLEELLGRCSGLEGLLGRRSGLDGLLGRRIGLGELVGRRGGLEGLLGRGGGCCRFWNWSNPSTSRWNSARSSRLSLS